MKFVIATLAIFLSTSALAGGHDVGNGGYVVSCTNTTTHKKTARLLEYYEAQSLWGLSLHYSSETKMEGKVENLISRLPVGEADKTTLRNRLKTFLNEAAILPDIVLNDVHDTGGGLALPKDCVLTQIVNQREVQYPFEKRYLIVKNEWDLLDEDQRAGLVFHELLYGLNLAADNSKQVRALNTVTIADLSSWLTDQELFNLLSETGLKKMVRNGYEFSTASGASFYPSGRFQTAYLLDTTITLAGQKIVIGNGMYSAAKLTFTEGGELSELVAYLESPLNFRDQQGQSISCHAGQNLEYQNGALKCE